ncbi:MAG TPA: glycosyltransferase [Acidobacteriaceae bacterium]|jgi:glycosyltransferase involved in cell wall biosynthesis|nr:glycosyltransferase [Acidobacteriaceae bacterium]
MRILHIVGTISPEAGGPTEVIRMLVRYAPPGYTSELATLDDPAAPFLANLPFPVHALGSSRKRWFRPSLLRWLRAHRNRFDGIMVHGLWEFTGLAALLAHGRIPYVVFTHGMLDPYFKRAFPAKHAKKWLYWLAAEYSILRRANCVLFTTDAERTLAAHSFWLHHWRPMVLPLGSEPPPTDTASLLSAFHAACPGAAGNRFLLFLGRINEKKGCDLLVRAFAELSAAHADLHLVMAGPDPANWRERLIAIAAPFGCNACIHWPGMLLGEAKWGAFAACEAFVLPSHQENFGIAVVEALASSRPALLTHPVNIAQDLAADGCALVEPDTEAGIKLLLTRWLALSPSQREQMSARAHETFLQRYNMRRNAEAILRVFDQLHTTKSPHRNPLPEAR